MYRAIKQVIDQSKHHLRVETGWSYLAHLKHSIHMGWWMVRIAWFGLLHGIVPSYRPNWAPKEVIKMYYTLRKSPHIKKIADEYMDDK